MFGCFLTSCSVPHEGPMLLAHQIRTKTNETSHGAGQASSKIKRYRKYNAEFLVSLYRYSIGHIKALEFLLLSQLPGINYPNDHWRICYDLKPFLTMAVMSANSSWRPRQNRVFLCDDHYSWNGPCNRPGVPCFSDLVKEVWLGLDLYIQAHPLWRLQPRAMTSNSCDPHDSKTSPKGAWLPSVVWFRFKVTFQHRYGGLSLQCFNITSFALPPALFERSGHFTSSNDFVFGFIVRRMEAIHENLGQQNPRKPKKYRWL